MWASILGLAAVVIGAAFAMWQGGWRSRERAVLKDFAEIAEKLPEGSEARTRILDALDVRVRLLLGQPDDGVYDHEGDGGDEAASPYVSWAEQEMRDWVWQPTAAGFALFFILNAIADQSVTDGPWNIVLWVWSLIFALVGPGVSILLTTLRSRKYAASVGRESHVQVTDRSPDA